MMIIIVLLALQVLWIQLVRRAQAQTEASIAQTKRAYELVDEWKAVCERWERTATEALRLLK